MKPKAILIGIDGVDYDSFRELSNGLKRLHHNRAYTGGVVGDSSQQATWSGPGWMTVLTGTWQIKHGVPDNDKSHRCNPNYPSVLQHLKKTTSGLQLLSIVTWDTIHAHLHYDLDGIEQATAANDQAAVNALLNHFKRDNLATSPPDMTFIQLSGPDLVGHANGYGALYDEALRKADAHLEQILDAVKDRQGEFPDEDWLVIVTTDHGRDKTGKGHGGQSIREKTIFIALNQQPNKELSSPVFLERQDELYSYAAQTAVAPTLMRHMGVVDNGNAWNMDSIPLVGNVGARKLRLDRRASTLRWFDEDLAEVELKLDGKRVADVPAHLQFWTNPARLKGSHSYAITLNDTCACLQSDYIQTVLDWNSTQLFFFFTNATYSRFNIEKNRIDPDYPRKLSNSTWQGIEGYQHLINAAFSADENYAFLLMSDGRYLKYDKKLDKVAPGYPMSITDSTWPGMGAYATQVLTAVRWRGDKAFIFLKNGTYLRYDLAQDRVDAGYPMDVNHRNWSLLADYKERLVAAVRYGDSDYAYFFLDDMRYLKYDMKRDFVDGAYPMDINSQSWVDLRW